MLEAACKRIWGPSASVTVCEVADARPDTSTSPSTVIPEQQQIPLPKSTADKDVETECYRTLITAFCGFAVQGTFYSGIEDKQGKQVFVDDKPDFGHHPLQDPSGALFTACLLLRLHCPDSRAIGQNGKLTTCAKQCLAAILSVACKFYSAQGNYTDLIVQISKQFFEKNEMPQNFEGWLKLQKQHNFLERELLTEDIFRIYTQNTQAICEHNLWLFHQDGKLTFEETCLLRGCTFFFVCALLMAKNDEFDYLCASCSGYDIAKGLTYLLIALLDKPTPPASFCVEHAAATFGHVAMSLSTLQLRVGPYSLPPPVGATKTQKLLSPVNLQLANSRFSVKF